MLVLCFTNTSNCTVYQAEVARAGTKSCGVASNLSIIGAVLVVPILQKSLLAII